MESMMAKGMNYREVISEDIYDNAMKIFYGRNVKSIVNVEMKKQSTIGFHLTDSARFVCNIKAIDHNNNGLAGAVLVKLRDNIGDEYQNMMFLWETHYAGKEKFVIPRPIFIDEKNHLLFMDYFSGESFFSLFYKNYIFGKNHLYQLIDFYIIKAAKWLRDFHSINIPEPETGVASDISDYEERVHEFPMLQNRIKFRLIDKINSISHDLPKFYDTYVHDQYLFRNIIFNDDNVCVVDFPHLRQACPLYDFFSFYIGLERMQQYPLVTKAISENMKQCFKSHYFYDSNIILSEEMFENLWVLFVVSTLKMRYKTPRGVKRAVNRRFIQQTLNKLVEWSKK